MSGVFGASHLFFSSGSTGFYDFNVTNSLRFNAGDSPYLQRTPSSDGDKRTWTWSTWLKRSSITQPVGGGNTVLFSAESSTTNGILWILKSDGTMGVSTTAGSPINFQYHDIVLRDFSAWYNFVLVFDTTQSTGADRIKIYLNGTFLTPSATPHIPSQNAEFAVNTSGVTNYVGAYSANLTDFNFNGYTAEINFIDGQALNPTSFGEAKSGVWIPKEYTGSYGTNGFRLQFKQTGTGTASSSTIGADTSGNDNHLTSNNFSAHDVVTDSPTNSYCIYNNADPHESTLSEGNLKVVTPTSGSLQYGVVRGTHAMTSGKWYWEVYMQAISGSGANNQFVVGITNDQNDFQNFLGGDATDFAYFGFNGNKYSNSTNSSYGDTFTTGDIVSVAYDVDNGNLFFYKNGTIQNSGTAAYTGISGTFFPAKSDGNQAVTVTMVTNFGQDGTFLGQVTAGNNSDGNGHGNFKYAVPSGYLALNADNLSEPTITPLDDDIPEDYFEANIWTGNGSSQSISSYEFAPDWVWIKERNSTSSHYLVDTVRGANLFLQSNSNVADTSNTVNVTSFDSNGFSLGSGGTTNQNNNTFVGWAWLAGGSASSNTEGSVNSSVSVNSEAGFSIVSFAVPSGSSTFTVGHGLGAKPAMIITKGREETDNWAIYHKSISTDENTYVLLNKTDTSNTATDIWGSAQPTTTVMGMKSGTTLLASQNAIAYCFAEIDGYSKFGSYTGNGNANGPYVHTGFRPSFILMKSSSSTENWLIYDDVRDPFNVTDEALLPNLSSASGGSSNAMDLLSNGFKLRSSSGSLNGSGQTYIYMAFAEMPFKYANAR